VGGILGERVKRWQESRKTYRRLDEDVQEGAGRAGVGDLLALVREVVEVINDLVARWSSHGRGAGDSHGNDDGLETHIDGLEMIGLEKVGSDL
jgi:hypothetical protein